MTVAPPGAPQTDLVTTQGRQVWSKPGPRCRGEEALVCQAGALSLPSDGG